MHINDFPYEILAGILEETTRLNERDGVSYTFGLSQAPLPLQKTKLQKYLKGPIPPDMLKWDATAAIRQVCRAWHEWSLDYSLKDVYLRRWRGSERWAELSRCRRSYDIYELIDNPSGLAVYRDPFSSVLRTAELLSQYPSVGSKISRLWFNGFYVTETDREIFTVLRSCPNLVSVSVPWTVLRHGSSEDWTYLLNSTRGHGTPLQSLELLAVDLPEVQAKDPANRVDLRPLDHRRVDFSKLRRLKVFGNTTFMPVCDQDLQAIARTATSLEELHITGLSTVSIEGVMALVKASQKTLKVLEHSPRSDDGFYHPHPGTLPSTEHLCDVLTACPKLKDLSISVPSMCPDLFSNDSVRWEGECQVRAARLCDKATTSSHATKKNGHEKGDLLVLQETLARARTLIRNRRLMRAELDIELFFLDCIFEPRLQAVHGDVSLAEISSNAQWPAFKASSSKGPYGATGLYGKDEGPWDVVSEEMLWDMAIPAISGLAPRGISNTNIFSLMYDD
ncbi:hypothetical protein B0A49_09483 [Cryomyces minteri]|uniref:F-box domain-containing protein n=1 Tax=Cryomyces minteri TaxID=331657 RepID=A0A4U0WFT4_9PEZI|nr:hypothetical protein B0A49_10401 [Cryomyces minteri]TKA63128.1 hypothetical protein B0A49_09483 [Cryomyces minteri]